MNFKSAVSSRSSLYSPCPAFVLGMMVLWGAPGCQPDMGEEDAGPELAVAAQEMRVANGLTTSALVLNAISTNAPASALLVGGGLQAQFQPTSDPPSYLQRQLVDADAQKFMQYLVGCALPEGQDIAWKHPITGVQGVWTGGAGLCPEWKTGPASETCQRWVSACLLARNNALGRRVELSIRGQDVTRPELFSLETQAQPVEYEPALETPVASYGACATPQMGMHRDCGWKAESIGRCTAGQLVRLGAGSRAPDQCSIDSSPVLGTSSPWMMLRVCDGLAGCDKDSGRMLGQNQGACAGSRPAVTFTCPASGTFNVMSAPRYSTGTGTVQAEVETGSPAQALYPSSEKQVFSLREGAYYGNLFDTTALAARVHVEKDNKIHGKQQRIAGAVYRGMFSCQAPEWTDAAAYASHRLCALPSSGENCAAQWTGLCAAPPPLTSRCATADGTLVAGDGDFGGCTDTSGLTWQQVITVFLHQPCSLLPESASTACRRIRN